MPEALLRQGVVLPQGMARTSILSGPAFQAPTFFPVSLAVVVPFYPVALSVTIVTAEHAMVKHSGELPPSFVTALS